MSARPTRRRRDTRLATAQHEAAHVVVGVAVGLELIHATAHRTAEGWHGYVQFRGPTGPALDLMYAAGIAWARLTRTPWEARGDREELARRHDRHGIEALTRAARAILESRAGIHARVTRALLDRDLTHVDVRRLYS